MAATDYDFQSSRTTLIQSALRKIGALEMGERISSEAHKSAVQALNEIVKSWQRRHVFLWTQRAVTQALTSGTQSYVLGTDPVVLSVEQAYLRDAAGTDTPLRVIPHSQFQTLWDKDDAGDPTLLSFYHYENKLYTYPVCNQAGQSLLLWVTVKLKDWDEVDGTGDFPVQFEDALIYALAAELAPEYGVSINERRDIRQEAEIRFRQAKAFDRERGTMDFVEGAF